MTAEAQVNAIIDGARSTADTARDKALQYSDEAQTVAQAFIRPAAVDDPDCPVIEFPPFDPDEDLAAAFEAAYNDAVADFDPEFQTRIDNFLNTYFPDFAACLKVNVDGWICDTIANGGTGIPAHVETQIWERSRERELEDAAREEDEAIQAFAGRGFTLPGGVLPIALTQIQQRAADKISTHARDVAIKQVEIEIENIKFAVEQGVRLRLGVVQALVQFIRAWVDMERLAIDKAKAIIDAKASLFNTSAAYLHALVSAGRLQLECERIRIEKDVKMESIFADFTSTNVRGRVEAAIASAQALATMAGAALSSLNTLAAIENTTINST